MDFEEQVKVIEAAGFRNAAHVDGHSYFRPHVPRMNNHWLIAAGDKWVARYRGRRSEPCESLLAAFALGELCGWDIKPPQRPYRYGYRLTDEGAKLAFDYRHESNGCSCHTGCAPCPDCTHPGNPNNAEEDDSLWEKIDGSDT
jgi:hypothetical protein